MKDIQALNSISNIEFQHWKSKGSLFRERFQKKGLGKYLSKGLEVAKAQNKKKVWLGFSRCTSLFIVV